MQVSLWWLNQANTIIESTKGFHPKSRFIQIISAVYPFSCGWEKKRFSTLFKSTDVHRILSSKR